MPRALVAVWAHRAPHPPQHPAGLGEPSSTPRHHLRHNQDDKHGDFTQPEQNRKIAPPPVSPHQTSRLLPVSNRHVDGGRASYASPPNRDQRKNRQRQRNRIV